METMLIVNGGLFGLALVQALVGIFFFRPGVSVITFFFQTLLLTASTVLLLGFEFKARVLCALVIVVFYLFVAYLGISRWKSKDPSKAKEK